MSLRIYKKDVGLIDIGVGEERGDKRMRHLSPFKAIFLAAVYGATRISATGVTNRDRASPSADTTKLLTVPPPSWTGYDATRVKVYVYDAPELDHSDVIGCWRQRNGGESPWQAERHDVARDMAEVWLHEALLVHPWRVQYPSQADLFYVPLYASLSYQTAALATSPEEKICGGWSHEERINSAVEFLLRKSVHFNRFGGADHMLASTHHDTRRIFDATHRMVLQRVVLGVHQRVLETTMWGCGVEKLVSLPYAAHSAITATTRIGGRPQAERDIPFFFVGSSQQQPERFHLQVGAKARESLSSRVVSRIRTRATRSYAKV